MARTRSLSSIETEISKVTAELQKAQEKVDELTQRLLELQEQKQSIEAKQIMNAFRRSGKSMQEAYDVSRSVRSVRRPLV